MYNQIYSYNLLSKGQKANWVNLQYMLRSKTSYLTFKCLTTWSPYVYSCVFITSKTTEPFFHYLFFQIIGSLHTCEWLAVHIMYVGTSGWWLAVHTLYVGMSGRWLVVHTLYVGMSGWWLAVHTLFVGTSGWWLAVRWW